MGELETIEPIEPTEESVQERRDRFSGWKFWLIALLLHVLLLVMLSQIGWIIQTGRRLVAYEDDTTPEVVDISVAIPGAPPGPGLAGPPTPDVKIPLAGVPAAQEGPVDAAAPVDFAPLQAVVSATGKSPFSLPGQQASGIPGAIAGLPGVGKAFGQGGSGTIPAAWGKRKNPARWSDPVTEAAVMKALRWLKDNQNSNGSWSKGGPPVAMTGLALLAFLAHGETQTSREFGTTVQNGISWLRDQAQNGRAGSRVEYETGIATYALAEAYGMTNDQSLKPVVEKCVETIIKGQTNGGGWEYNYATGSAYGDMSVSGWQIQALKSAYLTGIKPEEIKKTLDKAMEYANKVYVAYQGASDKGGFGYKTPGCQWTLTGTGLLCLLFWNQGSSPQAAGAAKFLRENVAFGIGKPLEGKIGGANNLYGYYYITQAMFMVDGPNGPTWRYWNDQFNNPKGRALIGTQKEDGSFPTGDFSPDPVYKTALSTLMLEVYYRNLPSTH